jgi:WD40 repeat protein
LLDTSPKERSSFKKSYLEFRAHNNAVLDLCFSLDDTLLATASGDQSCQIIDMQTQRGIFSLNGHSASVKEVRFQPGSGNAVIATCSRDGNIQVWDLRCKSMVRPVIAEKVDIVGEERYLKTTANPEMKYAYPTNLINRAHHVAPNELEDSANGRYSLRRARTLQSRLEPSVTTISYLSESNPHILLSGCDDKATVKVWDLRMKQYQRQGLPTPLTITSLPVAHDRYRHFGLTSMVLSKDSSRLYTLCKDNTVYVYSTAHLILGSSTELYNSEIKPKRNAPAREGLGPIYGFRHSKLKASSFYVKLALRTSEDHRSEMLATGSSSSCAILFPTDERLFGKRKAPNTSPRSNWNLARGESELPIYEHGTALVRGHDKEVTSVSWTSNGELVTVGDDSKCRVWSYTGDRARDLRSHGETEGNRWSHGWAECDNDNDHWDSD